MALEFTALHFADQLTFVNPRGTIGVVTLWSRVDYVTRMLESFGIDTNPATSAIAVIGTLYGNGLRELLRNLLFNPQIDTLLLFGRDRSGSAHELEAFFRDGLEPYEGGLADYEADEGEAAPVSMRIKGTSRVIDSLVRPELFIRPPKLVPVGHPQDPSAMGKLTAFLESYCPEVDAPIPERLEVPLPRVRVVSFPSNPRTHAIVARDAFTAWRELVFRLLRFGIPVRLAKGDRRELQGVKVVVEAPEVCPADDIEECGVRMESLRRYQEEIVNASLKPDETYSYGNRLRAYFGLDSLDAVAARLEADPEDRKAYAVLWDPRHDITRSKGHPCLVSLFFRRFQGLLTMTATFRTHNALDAWLVNFYGLTAIQRHIAGRCAMETGALTVFSHSITLDSLQMDRAALVASRGHQRFSDDPMGYFRITLDGDSIRAEHRLGDATLNVYRHTRARHIQQEIAADHAVSDFNHAIYLGRQLARAEACLQEGRGFVQE